MPFSRIYNLYISPDRKYVRSLRNLLGFVPGNVRLYRMAFRHKSVAVSIKENGNAKNSNERLEFLGDAILGSVIATLLFKKYPFKGEGFLTEMRSKIVSRANLNILAKKMGLNELIEYDAKMFGYNRQSSLLGDAFEALIGAIYLDKGYSKTQSYILTQIINPLVDIHQLENTETNFKSRLIEWCQHHNKEIQFQKVKNQEDEGSRLFTVEALIDGEVKGIGQDYNKKNAEKIAAEKACEELKVL
ncbi:ribonuclease III [Albibacterium bauzanense]|uniref:Ribonuclease 3 n=1 Tax=Albibacterium bauzanense TaxID=653929 RepID=A0A4R1LUK1_9SPHI|nr:ribonuclease III [Albibacterium bauzanense]TCK83038.1 ribonuclease-3 [Albibacterium bauzanense]